MKNLQRPPVRGLVRLAGEPAVSVPVCGCQQRLAPDADRPAFTEPTVCPAHEQQEAYL